MSIREHVSKSLRKAVLLLVLGLLGCLAIGFGGEQYFGPQFSMPLGMLLLFGSGIIGFSSIKCPRCANRLFAVAGYVKRKLLFLARVDFCPFCGVSMDAEVDGQEGEI